MLRELAKLWLANQQRSVRWSLFNALVVSCHNSTIRILGALDSVTNSINLLLMLVKTILLFKIFLTAFLLIQPPLGGSSNLLVLYEHLLT